MDRKGFRLRVPQEELPAKEQKDKVEKKITTFFGLCRHLVSFLKALQIRNWDVYIAGEEKFSTRKPLDHELASQIGQLWGAVGQGYSMSDFFGVRKEDAKVLKHFLETVYPVLRLFTIYGKVFGKYKYIDRHRILEKRVAVMVRKSILEALTKGARIDVSDLLIRFFESDFLKELDIMMDKLPMRKRRNLYAALQKIHRYVESKTFSRWFENVKKSAERNPTVLECDTENYNQLSLCSQSEKDHKSESTSRQALIVNNFLLFENYSTPTCLAIRNAKSAHGFYFVEGMLYLVSEALSDVLSKALEEGKKECIVEKGNFTFVRALSYNELQTYREIIKRHRDVREKPVR